MNYIMIKDKFYIAREEVEELERLLRQARQRQRRLLKRENKQGWLDWFLEWMGY